MPITFAVDEVVPAAEPAKTIGLRELIGPHLYLGMDGDPQVLPVRDAPPLLAAVHHAFAEHRPLVLSPDAVWLTIAQGVAHHVRLNAEALRGRFVRHDGRETLTIEVDAEPAADEWAPLVEGFRAMIGARVGEGIGRLMTCDFSTSGPVERIASEIVLMDMMSPYFDYEVFCICGIPHLTLLGTPADWRAIRARIDVIAELDLGWWTASLAPIVDQLVAAAEGRPDPAFFRAIYKPQEAYGRELIAGWAARLYPYVAREGIHDQRNPLLALALDAPLPVAERGMYGGPGIRMHDVPSHMAQALVRVTYQSGAPERLVILDGGLIAVEQDASGALVPRVGYVVREGGHTVAALVGRVRAAHHTVPGSDQPRWSGDGQLRAFFKAIGEATLFEGAHAWHVLPPEARERVILSKEIRRELEATRVVDLPDGTTLALTDLDRDSVVVRLRLDAIVPHELPETIVDEVTARTIRVSESPYHQNLPRWQTTESVDSIPVLEGSLIEILDRALSAGGNLALPTSGTVRDNDSDLWDTPAHAASLLERLRRDHAIIAAQRGLFDTIVGGDIRVGDERWTVVAPDLDRDISVTHGEWNPHVDPVLGLPGGRFLCAAGSFGRRCVVEIRADLLGQRLRRAAKGKRPAVYETVSSQPVDAMPVVGRNFVEVLEHALAAGALPPSSESFAEWLAREHR